MKKINIKLKGNFDIFSSTTIEKVDGKKQKWTEILIHGDPKGLKSFAELILQLANYDQDKDDKLPKGAREHIQLSPKHQLSKSSDTVILGRLDAKGTGEFYDRYKKKSKNNTH